LLSEKDHFVISALSLTYPENQITIFDSTKVSFKSLTDDNIKSYVKNFNVLDKAGSYNVEDAEEYFIKNIDGCYNNIVGFPEQKFLRSTIKIIIDKI
jgi:septum formation protein